ncbi:hypothetical protein S245_028185 [Arachis hypogaea]|nr:uncharacterized protein LOC112708079 [Arachis hypogaea]
MERGKMPPLYESPSSSPSRSLSPPFTHLSPSEELPWPLPSSSQVREREFACERGRCCVAVRCCAATATPCRRRQSRHRRHVSPPKGSLANAIAETRPDSPAVAASLRCFEGGDT